MCDTGPGVDGALVHRMFDPFCSTKPTGTGLGLPISRTIVHTHGGALDFSRTFRPVPVSFVRLSSRTGRIMKSAPSYSSLTTTMPYGIRCACC